MKNCAAAINSGAPCSAFAAGAITGGRWWVGVGLLPAKGLEELKIGYDITYGNLLPKLLKIGNLGLKLVM